MQQLAAAHVHLLSDGLAQRVAGHVGDGAGADLARFGVDQGQDCAMFGFVAWPMPGMILIGCWRLLWCMFLTDPADPRLVGHDGPGHGHEVVAFHGLADAVHHEPGRPGAKAVLALDLAGRDAILGRAHLKDHEHPLADGDLGPVERGVGQNRELLERTRRNATPGAGSWPRCGSCGMCRSTGGCSRPRQSAMGARRDAGRPAQFLKELVSVGLGLHPVRKRRNRHTHTSIIAGGCDHNSWSSGTSAQELARV